ncbi:MAG: hypothetical protein GX061_06060 [Eubacteriaceae bacterium]|nr:hypothetical protein [Eubacteriaceae bacterium]
MNDSKLDGQKAEGQTTSGVKLFGITLIGFTPPGVDAKKEIRGILWGMVLCAVISFIFFIRLAEDYNSLFYWNETGRVLREGAAMRSFPQMLRGCFYGYYALMVCMAFLVISHYLYFYRSSKSIYLMKRLKNPFELHIRCFALPLVACAGCVVAMAVTAAVYGLIYRLVTPKELSAVWGVVRVALGVM